MPVNRIAAAIACLSILAAQPAVPAEAPYFRFTAGGDGTAVPGTVGQGGALHPDGPSGAYTGRVGRPFATPAPRVAEGASGATWYLGAGPLPGGLSVSASTGAVSGIPGSEGSYGPLAVAVRTPDGRTARVELVRVTTPPFASFVPAQFVRVRLVARSSAVADLR